MCLARSRVVLWRLALLIENRWLLFYYSSFCHSWLRRSLLVLIAARIALLGSAVRCHLWTIVSSHWKLGVLVPWRSSFSILLGNYLRQVCIARLVLWPMLLSVISSTMLVGLLLGTRLGCRASRPNRTWWSHPVLEISYHSLSHRFLLHLLLWGNGNGSCRSLWCPAIVMITWLRRLHG